MSDKFSLTILMALGVGFIFMFGCHIWIWRQNPSSAPRVFLLKFLMAIGLVVSLLTFIVFAGFDERGLFLLTSLTVLIDMGYMYIYSAVVRSVSLTLLIQLLDAVTPIPLDRMILEYTQSKRFDDRVMVMQKAGLLSINGSSVQLTPRGKWAAKMSELISSLVSGKLEG